MWAEVIGLPGVGKTTLIQNNLESISKHFEIIESKRSGFLQKLYARFLYYFRIAPGMQDKKLARKLSYRLSFRWFKSAQAHLFFFDSGVAQLVLENLIETDFANKAKKLEILQRFKRPDILIVVGDKPDNVIQRELMRSDRRFDCDEATLAALYKKAEEVLESDFKPLFTQVHIVKPGEDQRFKDIITNAQSH
ncbi:MAG: GTPase domain-containing protein [Alphaproteobacteria bacterium]